MLHVNRIDGLTIAVSENRYITQVASRTHSQRRRAERAGADSGRRAGLEQRAHSRLFFESHGFALREWDKVRTDTITLFADRGRGAGPCSDIGRGMHAASRPWRGRRHAGS